MSERTRTYPPFRENRVVEFVLASDSLQSYARLNGRTPQQRNERFTNSLKRALHGQRAGRRLGEGASTLLVQELEGNPDVVVKRLKTATSLYHRGSMSIDEYWEHLKKEHALAEKFFGRRFVPYTEFLILDGSLGDDPEVRPGKEYVMVQEKIDGSTISLPYDYPDRSPHRFEETVEFIKCYERMVREGGAIIDKQVISDVHGNLKLGDTNRFTYFKDALQNSNVRKFFDQFAIDPESINNTGDIINALKQALPQLSDLRDADDATFVKALQLNNRLFNQIHEDLVGEDELAPDRELREHIAFGFMDLTILIDDFPPQGHHNPFITRTMANFRIKEGHLLGTEPLPTEDSDPFGFF